MATHTETANYSGRKFTISRKDGQQNKDGDPYFFEWIKEIPQTPPNSKRIFETRPKKDKTDYFELFQKIDGYFVGAAKREVNFGDKTATHLFIFIVDGEEDYTIDLGEFAGRYAMDFEKRLLDPNFDPEKRISLQPYAILNKDSGRWNIGVSVYSGLNKMEAKVDSPQLAGLPQAEEEKLRNGTSNWYFDKPAEWLWEKLNERVLAKIVGDPISFKSAAPQASRESSFLPPPQHARSEPSSDDFFPTEEPLAPVESDPLPF